MFPRRRGISSTWHSRARSLDGWRAAALLVWARWEAFLEAPPDTRGRAFAAYLAALDAEAAAAGEIADLSPTVRA
jgi:hypothetical protein